MAVNRWFEIYRHMPVWAQNCACSVAGLKMRRERYNGTFNTVIRFLRESQWWSFEIQKEYQNEQLRRVIKHAYETVQKKD